MTMKPEMGQERHLELTLPKSTPFPKMADCAGQFLILLSLLLIPSTYQSIS